MRVIAGRLKGQTFDSPGGHRTHPMSEKIRGAIFNALGDIEGLTFFDAYSGSGALAIEAVSRGAKSVLATDVSKEAYDTITANIKKLAIDKYIKVVRANTSGWCDNNLSARFDIVMADPPYDDVQLKVLVKLAGHVKKGGLYVLSLPPTMEFDVAGFNTLAERDYGDAKVVYLSKL